MYALEERIGEPSLFCGRQQEMELLLNWIAKIPKKRAKSRALLGRRKSGKTAIMQRLFNILWQHNGKVIPFYFEVLDQDQWLLDFANQYFRTFLTHYISFKTRKPLDKENLILEWGDLNKAVKQINNKDILRVTDNFQEHLLKEHAHDSMKFALGAPAAFSGYDDVFFVVMIDEIQYMTQYIYHDKACTNLFRNLPGGYHGLVELKYAPMLVSGSYIGWMTQMIHEMFVGGRLRRMPISPKLSFNAGMQAVYKYAELNEVEISDQSALLINILTQSDPFYIDTLLLSEWPQCDFTTEQGVINTFAHEILDKNGELYRTWSEYIILALKTINNKSSKKIMLYLSKERHRECTLEEIRNYLDLKESDDHDLEEKLRALEYGGLIKQGHTDFHYQGIPDDILDLIFRKRYQFEIERVDPDVKAELSEKIKLQKKIKSLQGRLNELKGRLLELIVWRELNQGRKKNKVVANFAGRLRKISEPNSLQSMIKQCCQSKFTRVWMNYYIQLPQTFQEVDVLAEGQDDEFCWALIFEIKNRDAENPPTKHEVKLFVEKIEMLRQVLETNQKKIKFICPLYLSAKGFSVEVEALLHQNNILTADLETWLNQ